MLITLTALDLNLVRTPYDEVMALVTTEAHPTPTQAREHP